MKDSIGCGTAMVRRNGARSSRRAKKRRTTLIWICGLGLVTLLASQATPAAVEFSVNPGAREQPTSDESRRDGSPVRGDGVVLATGNRIDVELDFAADEEMGLFLRRTYNHHWNGIGLFGKHWLSNFDYSLAFSPGTAWVQRPDGRRLKFVSVGTNRWNEDKTQPIAYLVRNADGTYTHYNEDRGSETYNAAGYITALRNEQGLAWTFVYNGAYLQRVVHTSGRSVQFVWANGQITQVVDPAGSAYQYAYAANVFGTGRGRLTSVVLPGSPATTIDYHYEDSRFAGALTGRSVNGIRVSTVAYDEQARAVRTERAGGIERYSFSYVVEGSQPLPLAPPPPPPGGFQLDEKGEDERGGCVYRNGGRICYQVAVIGVSPVAAMASLAVATMAASTSTQISPTRLRVTETNSLGRQSVYVFDNGRLVSIESGSKVGARTYDANGYLNLVHDFEAGVSDYDYDAHGHLTRKVEAVGTPAEKTTTLVWDEARNRLIEETIAGQRGTTYSYAADGRVAFVAEKNLAPRGAISQVRQTAYTYTYQANGLLASKRVDGPVAGSVDAVTFTYGTTNFLYNVKDGAGLTTSFANYNDLGQPGRITGPNGEVTEYTYDPRGRVTSTRAIVNGVAQVTSYSYDGFGHTASVRTPDGITTTYAYDAADRLLRTFRPDGRGAYEQVRYAHNAASQVTSETTERTTQAEWPATLPATPGLSAPAVNDTGSFSVQWGAISGAVSYRLEESVNGGSWTQVRDSAATQASFTGKGTTTPFAYRARACNAAGCSGVSNVVTVQPVVYAAEFVGQSVPARMSAGRTYSITVQMRNTGNTTWSTAQAYSLGSQAPADTMRWGISRANVPGLVAPGATATFTFLVTAPGNGQYAFQWRMVRDGHAWFGAATPSATVSVQSGWITASPNPCVIPGLGATCAATISWGASAAGAEVRVTNLDNSGLQLVQGNTQSGSLTAPWIPLEGKRFHLMLNGVTLSTVDVRGQLTPHAAQFLGQNLPTTMVAGRWYPVSVAMKNTGGAAWYSASGFNLGAQNPADNTRWGTNRVGVPGQVGTGQTASFNFSVRAPDQAGTHNFQWRMVQDGVTWFGDQTANVPVTVLSGWISANPCTIRYGGSNCTSTVSWGSSHGGAEVWVTDLNGNGAQLFYSTTQNGSAAATWITAAGFRFYLKLSGQTLATVDLRGIPTTEPPPEPDPWQPPPGCKNCYEP